MINRFHGNTIYPYSVAQHEIALYYTVPEHLRKAAIVHDFSEAWFNDLASPIKAECKDYKRAEKKCTKFMMDCHGISPEDAKELDHYDKAIYLNERDELFKNIKGVGMGDKRVKLDIDPKFFEERQWRDVKADLIYIYNREFGS